MHAKWSVPGTLLTPAAPRVKLQWSPAAWCEGIAAKALEAAYLVVQLRQTPQGEHNYVKRRKEIVEQEQEQYDDDEMCMKNKLSSIEAYVLGEYL